MWIDPPLAACPTTRQALTRGRIIRPQTSNFNAFIRMRDLPSFSIPAGSGGELFYE
jgi:hypothetical protein